MNNGKHLNFEQRKIINNMISHGAKLCEIGKILEMDPTSISKEIKRNRFINKERKLTKVCKNTIRYPFVCNGCKYKYTTCKFTQFTYEAKRAQEQADTILITSRSGINMTHEEFETLDNLIKKGVSNKESIYHIVKSNEQIKVSVPTVYRYINDKKLTTKKLDLPYAVKYKKRKEKKKYEYKNNKIDRSNRTYSDFLAFRLTANTHFYWQMDFLGSIKSDTKEILTLNIPDLHFVLILLIELPNANKIDEVFNTLEINLGIHNFIKIIPYILTDRDPCFSKFEDIEFSKITGEQRTHLFYCDAFTSCQKGSVENMNKQLRKFFPKGTSVDNLTNEQIKEINMIILNTRVASLNGATPLEIFEKVYGKDILKDLLKILDR